MDKVYPMQQLMRRKGKKFTWNEAADEPFQRIKKELCEAPVLGMPTEKVMYVLDTDASTKNTGHTWVANHLSWGSTSEH